jgi:hypothetical protein
MSRPSSLYTYVNRCGAVTVTRAALPQLARDLNLRERDLRSLIARMAAVGQVTTRGDLLRFAMPEQSRACPNLLPEFGLMRGLWKGTKALAKYVHPVLCGVHGTINRRNQSAHNEFREAETL